MTLQAKIIIIIDILGVWIKLKELIDFKDKFNGITTSNEDIARLTLSLYDVYQTFFYEYQTFKGNLQNINPQLLSIINNLVSITCYKANNF